MVPSIIDVWTTVLSDIEEAKIVEDFLELKRLLGIIICFHSGRLTMMMKMKNYLLKSLLD